ncbi:NAD-dependent deacylase [Telmatocola sphagniphila]|uniref:NAD-dependent protein deacylase n=1 Tax=Telmatocola sphagniphila TaxID=1123043 RepID=A0A8E6ETC0_9BACT|nr:NAD-dependent deacylase [Telmatocola sphagniphila]QVL32254.1 NAD-dependent deacylase [Telmatocola sphagniphila]
MDAIFEAAEHIRQARYVTVLTGAGVSAESGVPTFRASDGLWEGHHIEDVATPEGFRRNPHLVWEFYNERRNKLKQVRPNPGHYALVELEKRFAERFTLVTQNVDGLHQQAGSNTVAELHGSLYRTRCTGCKDLRIHDLEPLGELPKCQKCDRLLRPDIVWFREELPKEVWQRAYLAAQACDVFLLIGTSAVVYPAAGLAQIARNRGPAGDEGATIIEFNLEETAVSNSVDLGVYGPSGVTLPKLIEQLSMNPS